MIVAMQLVIPILIVTPRVSALVEHRRVIAPALAAAALLLAAAAGRVRPAGPADVTANG